MPFEFNGDIMAQLKDKGWSEYRIRKEKVLSAATIKAIKSGYPEISIRSLDRICHMLGDVSADSVIKYTAPVYKKRIPKDEFVASVIDEWYANGGKVGPDLDAHLRDKLIAYGYI